MKVIGITGGVGSGKSEVLGILKRDFGAELLIADETAHQVMEPGMPAYRRIVEALGTDFLSADGSIDRKALAKRLFGDGEALGTVNSIVHPTVWQAIEESIRCSRKELVIVEAALFDEEHNGLFDQVWYIFTSEENRISRLMKSRGYSREKCLDIMRSQKSESEFRAMADRVIDNNKTVADVKRQIETILKEEAEA
ncbi:dephospho-CoA kinase [butyrate-producing bacterium SM4/1]|nr:dephospho-CoA kinase [butyrate-producing bacterium SM4/1]